MYRVGFHFVLCALALSAAVGPATAQGFGIMSGRNHPELTWQVAETEHFRIMYPQRLEGIETEAAAIAEASYTALSRNLRAEFDRKIDIFLSDEDEIVNGFAVPIGNGYTNIWVHVPEFARAKTGSEKWLRSVVAHELAHIFHYQKVFDRPRWVGFLFGDPLPRFWTEGIAQYETEEWTGLRGDRWLRTAVLEDKLSYADGQSVWNGRLLYAVGNAQVRYLADRYGDSTLVEILEHRKPVLFGLTKVHDFETAFRTATGSSYRSFYDDWRRHVNVYYNTLAGGLENADSLESDPIGLPGQYYFDVSYSPDTSHVSILSLTSLQRPVQRLWVVDRADDEAEIVAEGSIQAPIAWSPDGRRLAYSRLHRGSFGSILRDLYIVERDGSRRRQITHNRRAGSPAFSPDGERLAYAAADFGTENIYIRHLASGAVDTVTTFAGDVQVSSIRWHPDGEELLFDRFRQDGVRDIAVVSLATGKIRSLTAGEHDDRDPVYSPDGTSVAYTSLRDDVPNVFVLQRTTGEHRRVTNLASGATVMDWLPADSLFPDGSLIITAMTSKTEDRAFRINASRQAPAAKTEVLNAYASWTSHRPPATIPSDVDEYGGYVTERYAYRSWENLRHVASLAFPYVGLSRDLDLDFGVAGLTSWIEPLGKHALAVAGAVSARDPVEESYLAASYVNNQWFPTIGVNLYRIPGSARAYGDDLLVEAFSGGDLTLSWPLDWSDQPYTSYEVAARLRFVDVEALSEGSYVGAGISSPEEGQQADLRVSLTWRKQRPYWNNVIHPLDGLGARLRLTGAGRVLGADTQFLRGDVAGYGIFRSLGLHRIYVYGRAQAQAGEPFAQNFLGLSRHDPVQIRLPNEVPLLLGDAERVRGFQSYALGERMLFGSAEYRVPLVSSMRTTLLGLASLGSLAVAAFVDAAAVWSGADFDDAIRRIGLGVELKNALRLGAGIELAHALGAAQPARELGNRSEYEIYYRVRTTVPF